MLEIPRSERDLGLLYALFVASAQSKQCDGLTDLKRKFDNLCIPVRDLEARSHKLTEQNQQKGITCGSGRM